MRVTRDMLDAAFKARSPEAIIVGDVSQVGDTHFPDFMKENKPLSYEEGFTCEYEDTQLNYQLRQAERTPRGRRQQFAKVSP